MKITYVHHSCFLIECDKATIVTDYWEDTPDEIVRKARERGDKPLYVLSSHVHHDHFNPEIIFWDGVYMKILSNDIRRKNKPLRGMEGITWLHRGEEYEDERVKITACGSTDVGVSYLIEIEGWKIYHAGDFNDWQRPDIQTEEQQKVMHGHFVAELEKMKPIVKHCDVALYPVDPHIGDGFRSGVEQFCREIKPVTLIPMHSWEMFEEMNSEADAIEKLGVGFIKIDRRGQVCIDCQHADQMR
ncbi:MAG: MBL fold metallo-hydrolase [Bacteroidales bacterium]|nr:MBL fold metallo-hydrolase [Bacteroidales bacterium]